MVLSAACLLTASARGQAPSPTGNLYGTAVEIQGNAVAGVTVTLTGPGAAQTADTDAKGDFHFLGLSPGDYSLLLERTGFEATRRDATITTGRNVVLTILMPIAGVAETVSVSGDAPALDSRSIKTGATFGQKELESIPTSRDLWSVLQQVPGVLVITVEVGGVRQGQPPFVGKGSHPEQNAYNLDGVPISANGKTPFFFDFDSISNIEVTTGGSDLSIATPGVTVNLVTKRGTNDLRGSSRGLYTFGSGWDYGIEAGGPLRKDRLWLWGAFARNDFLSESFVNRIGEPFSIETTFRHWNGKLDAQPVPSNTLSVSYTNFQRVVPDVSPDRSRESSRNSVHPGVSYQVEDSQAFSSRLFASAYLSHVAASFTSNPVGGIGEQADLDAEGIWRHSFQTRRLADSKHQGGATVSGFFDTGNLRHEAKVGFGYRHLRFDSGLSWPGNALVGYAQFDEADVTRLQKARAEANLYDASFGDTIRSGSLTVNVGARFDYQQGRNLSSEVPANPAFPELLPAVQYGGDSGYPVTWRLIQPRIGVTYALGANRTLLRASYSRFSNELNSDTVILVNAFPSVATLGYGWTDANGNGRVEPSEVDFSSYRGAAGVDPNDPGSSVQINRIAANFRTPTTDELLIGIERQIASNFSGSLAYTYRVSRNLEMTPLIGTTRASYRYFGNATGTAVDAAGFKLPFDEPYYGLEECPDPCAGVILRNRADASEIYSGVELQLVKSYSHGWMARASFAYNGLRQRAGPGALVDPNESLATDIDATWQFNVSGMVELPFGIAAGANVFGRQGFPIFYSVAAVTNDRNFNVPLVQIGEATRYRTPNVYEVDLQLSKDFRIGSRLTVIPQVGCFNLLDSRTVLFRSGFVGLYEVVDGVPTFTQDAGFNGVEETLAGRVFRVGVRIAF